MSSRVSGVFNTLVESHTYDKFDNMILKMSCVFNKNLITIWLKNFSVFEKFSVFQQNITFN